MAQALTTSSRGFILKKQKASSQTALDRVAHTFCISRERCTSEIAVWQMILVVEDAGVEGGSETAAMQVVLHSTVRVAHIFCISRERCTSEIAAWQMILVVSARSFKHKQTQQLQHRSASTNEVEPQSGLNPQVRKVLYGDTSLLQGVCQTANPKLCLRRQPWQEKHQRNFLGIHFRIS